MKKLSRREIVAGSAAVALGSTAPASEASAQARQPARQSGQPKENRPRKVSPWITLEPKFIEKTFDNTRVRLRGYNGQVPGPPIKTTPGETLRIRVKNSLPPYDSTRLERRPQRAARARHHQPALARPRYRAASVRAARHLRPAGRDDRDRRAQTLRVPVPAARRPSARSLLVSPAPSRLDRGAGGERHGRRSDRLRRRSTRCRRSRRRATSRWSIQDIGVFPSETGRGSVDLRAEAERDLADLRRQRHHLQSSRPAQNDPTNLKGGFTTGDYALRFYLLNGEPFFKEEHNQSKRPTARRGADSRRSNARPRRSCRCSASRCSRARWCASACSTAAPTT